MSVLPKLIGKYHHWLNWDYVDQWRELTQETEEVT